MSILENSSEVSVMSKETTENWFLVENVESIVMQKFY